MTAPDLKAASTQGWSGMLWLTDGSCTASVHTAAEVLELCGHQQSMLLQQKPEPE